MEVLALLIIVLAVVGLQGVIFRKFALENLVYKCEFNVAEAHEGDEIYLVETVENRKLLPVPWLKANIYTSRWLEFAGARSVVSQENRYATSSFHLRSYQKIKRRWKVKCLKRGVFTINTSTLVSGDLLGCCTSSAAVEVNAVLKVYPATIGLDEIFVPNNYLQGETIVNRWVIDDPFIVSGTREYTPWDPMNRIHWRATAKEGRFMVRKNDYTSQLSLAVLFNVQSTENEYFSAVDKDIVEFGIKVAASIFDMSLRMGMPVRFATNGTTSGNGRDMVFTGEASGKEHMSQLLEILAKLELKRIKDFEDFLQSIQYEISNSDIIIITSYLSEGICMHARRFKQAQNRISVLLLNEPDKRIIPDDINVCFIPKSAQLTKYENKVQSSH